jgi:DNA-binding transcriptional LysR family regulator
MGVDMMQGNHFSKLSAFVAVAEHRHFSKAAAQLGISPSTLTQAIRALEEHLGVRLLNRTTRSVSLTAAGEQLLHHMQPVMGAINDALDAMNNLDWEPRMSGLFLYYSSRRQVPAPLRAFIAFMRRHKNAVRSDQIAQPGPADDQMISSQPRSAPTRPDLCLV